MNYMERRGSGFKVAIEGPKVAIGNEIVAIEPQTFLESLGS